MRGGTWICRPPRVIVAVRSGRSVFTILLGADSELVEDPDGVQLAGRLDDPPQLQRSERLIGGRAEPERVIEPAQRIPQQQHPVPSTTGDPGSAGRGGVTSSSSTC